MHPTASQAVCLMADAAVRAGWVEQEDRDYCVNQLLALMALDAPEQATGTLPMLDAADILYQDALSRGLVQPGNDARGRFVASLFGAVTPPPQVVRDTFARLYKGSPAAATDWFYRMCQDTDYIKTRDIARNVRYQSDTPAGTLEITINLSKPEKDPRDIAAALQQKAISYPLCQLCRENPGYAGRPGFPARHNHRIIPLKLCRDAWYLQYSPYLYYDEHCIVFNREHTPMVISRASLQRMVDFVDQFPHYFVGSNADLPIVGGSILTHDHFQGGRYEFPLDRAGEWFEVALGTGITAHALTWPTTCLRLVGRDGAQLVDTVDGILTAWRAYSDPEHDILAHTDRPHNTITPVVRKRGDMYTVYVMLRNNRTTAEHPMGLFHPHQDKHHIKKENIGLIEAMGMFILPGRLLRELDEVAQYLAAGTPLPENSPHVAWAASLKAKHPALALEAAHRVIRDAVGDICYRVLCDTGVYKQTEQGKQGLKKFLNSLAQ